jgi:apolipoprotein N-acyltransferase
MVKFWWMLLLFLYVLAVVVAVICCCAANLLLFYVVVDFPRDDPVKTVPTPLPSDEATWAVHESVQSSFGCKGLA